MATGTLSGNTCSSLRRTRHDHRHHRQTVASGNCYLLTLTGTDNVGNTATITTTVKVDTTAPSAPDRLQLRRADERATTPAAGSIVFFKGGAAGGFTATASGATDADSGIASYTYGAIAGSGWSNAAGRLHLHRRLPHRQPPRSPPPTTPDSPAAARASPRSPTPPRPPAAPSPPTARQPPAPAPRATSPPGRRWRSTAAPTTPRRPAAPRPASPTRRSPSSRRRSPETRCGAYGAPATITGTTSQTVASGNCYLLTLTGTDNVGNTATDHAPRSRSTPPRRPRRPASASAG